MADKNIVRHITVNAETVEGLLKLHYQLQRLPTRSRMTARQHTRRSCAASVCVEKALTLLASTHDADFASSTVTARVEARVKARQ